MGPELNHLNPSDIHTIKRNTIFPLSPSLRRHASLKMHSSEIIKMFVHDESRVKTAACLSVK